MDSEKIDTAIYAFTSKGLELAKKIATHLKSDIYVPERLAKDSIYGFNSIFKLVSKTFNMYKNHIFISATAIAVRSIAPHIRSKKTDPAVVVLDQQGKYCISLLSGHLGGANRLSKKIAHTIGAIPVITTATDNEGIKSIDLIAKEKGMEIINIAAIKKINIAMLEKNNLQIYDPECRLSLDYEKIIKIKDEKQWKEDIPGIWVSWKRTSILKNKLVLVPKCLVIGIGCNKATGYEEIEYAIKETFESHRIFFEATALITSIDKKRNEDGIIKFLKKTNLPVKFFSSEELNSIAVPNPSEYPKKYVRTKSVCEASAIIGAKMGKLIVPKQRFKNVTIAVALKKES